MYVDPSDAAARQIVRANECDRLLMRHILDAGKISVRGEKSGSSAPIANQKLSINQVVSGNVSRSQQ